VRLALFILVLSIVPPGWVLGQTSSLYLAEQARQAAELAAATQPASNGALRANAGAAVPQGVNRNVVLAGHSLTALRLPEPKVIQVNDFIGVVVRYRLRHASDAKVEQKSDWDVQAKLDAWFRLHDRRWRQQAFPTGEPEIDFGSKNDMKNEGKADRDDVLETRLMAKVIDVKPNGNLVIVGWSCMQIDDESQYLRLSGECHPDQLSADNTIASDKIFGLDVRTMNEGAVKDAVKRGWFKELLDTAKPF